MSERRTAKQMGRPLTAKEQLENLDYFLTHCDKCEKEVPWGSEVCEHCGYELMQYGKH